ncbi:MAG: DUF5666 domain-containing protein [Thermoanaerobaculaceae bacterium]
MKAVVVSLAWVLLAATAEGANFVGQITKVAIKTFTVKGGEQTKEFLVAEQTVFQKGSKRVCFRELKVGQEVTVVFTEEKGQAVAQQVRIAPEGEKERHHARE